MLKRVMCWFHMVKAFEDHASFNSIPSPQKESIKQDICSLQLSESKAVFDAAYKLIKDEGTYRVKLCLGRFLEVVKTDILEKWSKERDTEKPYS